MGLPLLISSTFPTLDSSEAHALLRYIETQETILNGYEHEIKQEVSIGSIQSFESIEPKLAELLRVVVNQIERHMTYPDDYEALFRERKLKRCWKELGDELKTLSRLLEKVTKRNYSPTKIWTQIKKILLVHPRIKNILISRI